MSKSAQEPPAGQREDGADAQAGGPPPCGNQRAADPPRAPPWSWSRQRSASRWRPPAAAPRRSPGKGCGLALEPRPAQPRWARCGPPPRQARSAPSGVPVPSAAPLSGPATHASGPGDRRDRVPDQRAGSVPRPRPSGGVRSGGASRFPAASGSPPRRAQNPTGPLRRGGQLLLLAAHPLHRRHRAHRVARAARRSPWATSSTSGAVRSGPARSAQASGHVTAIYNGHVYRGDPANIPLTAHAQIQLEIGKPAAQPGLDPVPQGPVVRPPRKSLNTAIAVTRAGGFVNRGQPRHTGAAAAGTWQRGL